MSIILSFYIIQNGDTLVLANQAQGPAGKMAVKRRGSEGTS